MPSTGRHPDEGVTVRDRDRSEEKGRRRKTERSGALTGEGEKPGDCRRGRAGNRMFGEDVGRRAKRNKDARKRANILAPGTFPHGVFTTFIATTKTQHLKEHLYNVRAAPRVGEAKLIRG